MGIQRPQPASDGERSNTFVQSLERGLAVIRAFGDERQELTLSDVARKTRLSRASARRFLHTLVELGYVGTSGRAFYLRPRLLELGYAYLSGLTLPEVAQPHMRRLARETGESCSVAVLDGFDMVYIARVGVYRIMSASIGVGTRFPAFATSMGRAIVGSGTLAQQEEFLDAVELVALTPYTITDKSRLRDELDRVRVQGWARVDEELEVGLRSVAAPIRDATGLVVAAVNVAAPTTGEARSDLEVDLVGPLLGAANGIGQDLMRTGTRIR